MRAAFVKGLVELAEQDPRILLLTADLGYTVLEPFAERFPDRFYNVGVAEQNMVGLATGLAEAGFIPFVYSIVSFACLRPYEFIRNGPILQHLPVRVVGVGGGIEYAYDGPSHYGLEDIGVLRVQPGISVVAPADYRQAHAALLATWDMPGPVYYRLGKDDKTTVPGLEGRFGLGRVETIREGDDLLIVAMGSAASEAARAAEMLAARGTETTVVVVASVNPPPIEDLSRLLARFRLAIAVEAHYVVGGVGSLVSEVVAQQGLDCRVTCCGVRSVPYGISGSQSYMYGLHGIASECIVETATSLLGLPSERNE